MRIEATHRFEVPLRPAYDYMTNPAHWPEWWPGLVSVAPGWAWSQAGDRSRVTMKIAGREVQLSLTLTRMEPYRLVEYTSVQSGMPDARHTRRFEETNGGFTFDMTIEFDERSGPRGLIDRLVVRRVAGRALARTGTSLRRRFQEGAAG